MPRVTFTIACDVNEETAAEIESDMEVGEFGVERAVEVIRDCTPDLATLLRVD